MHIPKKIKIIFTLFIVLFIHFNGATQYTTVGQGSYTNAFPGTDSAGRNSFPSGTPQISGNALGKPVPTNDWWSALLKNDHANNLFNYPMGLRTVNEGLVVNYVVPASTPNGSSQPMGPELPVVVGVSGLNTNRATVSDYSDWTVTINWNDNTHHFEAIAGIGMPFIYFTKSSSDEAKIVVTDGNVVIDNEMLIITDSAQGSDYAVYAPVGSSWSQSGTTYTSDLNGKNYWSMAFLPPSASAVTTVANEYKKHAYVFPGNTTTTWSYNESNAKLTTTFTVTTDVKEGTASTVLLGLLPHQWVHLATTSAQPNGYTYSSIRGEIKTLDGNTFIVENTFKGILPTLPYLDNYSSGFSPAALDDKISQIENEGLATWTDSYNEGQVMNRMIQTARIADETGDIVARDKMILTIKERLEDWLKAEPGEVAFLFYYNDTWSAMLGYPAGHGQDNNINDHHFHWGYFIHAAAFMEQFEPGWADQWGEMINLLIRDAASDDRNDTQFPFLRNFSPYAGHSWANGFATFPFGNDQESTSESMQFASSLIHWGTLTENDAIRDLGIYIYTTEQTAIEEYWFDMHQRTFKPGYGYSLASRIWGNGYDNQTFFTSDIAAAYGIEMYPIHGGSLYLGHNTTYAQSLWAEISSHTGILSNEANPHLWHDTYWKYLSFTDPQAAIDLYDSYPDRSLKFGISDAQTYHWLHAMNALGTVNATITADYPIAASFTKNGEMTYVAHNYSDAPITVTFSDGYALDVPANEMVTSRDIDVTGVLSSDFNQAYPGGSVRLTAAITGTGVTKIEFFDGSTSIREDTSAPYEIEAENLTLGIHGMYAKVFVNDAFNITNIVNVQVGEQVPYLTTAYQIPGIIEAGNYDRFEGGVGQNIAYVDTSQDNQGNYRTDEYVDAVSETVEGKTVGWITAGEWLEYSIDVQTAGFYNVIIRYASGNSNGGGPFHFEIDGTVISSGTTLTTTNDWSTWVDKVVTNVELTEGSHILRLVVTNGEFNIGKMDFSYVSSLNYVPPIANAGTNVVVILPETTASLDGSLSNDPEGQTITYNWEQIYGPSIINFDNNTSVSPAISNLEEGVYKCKLTVSDGTYSASSFVLVIVQANANANPTATITAPADNSSFAEGTDIMLSATASYLDGTVSLVEFYNGAVKIGEDTIAPFSFTWTGASPGTHQITAVATDNEGTQGTSQIIHITVNEVVSCSETSNEHIDGNPFSVGYTATFETIGSNVTITFELLDTDRTGVVAYLWQQSPFSETQMDHVSGLTFSKIIGGLTTGATISYACKFAYAGGLSVTKYISYVVGDNCNGNPDDTEAPTNFSAAIGTITSRSVELLLTGTDDSGTVIYDISYGSETMSTTGDSGVQKSFIINGLTPETVYDFSIEGRDITGNTAANNPIALQATTTEDTNTACSGTSSEAQQGTFDIGYTYHFETSGNAVTFTFELLDNKTGVIAYLWQESPFTETLMDHVSGLTFSKTISGQTIGSTISYACKFAFAGGLAVTKYFSYEVGNNCTLSIAGELWNRTIKVYPNPVTDVLYTTSFQSDITKIELFSLLGTKIKEMSRNLHTIHVEELSSGLYFIKIHTARGFVTKKILKR